MTFIFGRRRLVISLGSAPSARDDARFPMAMGASDRELVRLSRLGAGVADRFGHDFHRPLYGGRS